MPNQSPSTWQLHDLLESCATVSVEIGNEWMPARPLGDIGIINRFKAAWLVLTGRADAVIWPGGQ